ncbi:MAG TPA: hypothetical protein VMI31_09680 [Fimbriimonadaceae bacterium]|nr:hypothetical protein [Fimbriimonadaceae bacterium]
MPLPPLMKLLDPRPADEARARPIADAANIPADELGNRMHELGPRGSARALGKGLVQVCGPEPWASRAVEVLAAAGREFEVAAAWTFVETCQGLSNLGPEGPELMSGRLWEPNPFLVEVAARLEPGRAVDFACGTGRDGVALTATGWQVLAIDHLSDALDRARDLGRRYLAPEDAARIHWLEADLESEAGGHRTAGPPGAMSPPMEAANAELISMFWYLNRPLIQACRNLLSPGGSLVIETFTAVHRETFGKPRREHFALNPGELPDLVEGMKIEFSEEAWHGDRHSARLWARRS